MKSKIRLNGLIIIITAFGISCAPRIFNRNDLIINEKTEGLNTSSFRIDGYYYHRTESIDYLSEIPKQGGGVKKIADSEFKRKEIETLIFYSNGYVYCSDNSLISVEIEVNKTIDSDLKRLNCYDSVLVQFEHDLRNERFASKPKRGKKSDIWNWGIYKVHNDSILIQYYRNELGDYYLIEQTGILHNDSRITILSEKEYKSANSKGYFTDLDKTYNFRHLDTKPDSVNYIMMNEERFGE